MQNKGCYIRILYQKYFRILFKRQNGYVCVCVYVRVCKGENIIFLVKNKVRNRYDSFFR